MRAVGTSATVPSRTWCIGCEGWDGALMLRATAPLLFLVGNHGIGKEVGRRCVLCDCELAHVTKALVRLTRLGRDLRFSKATCSLLVLSIGSFRGDFAHLE